MTSVNPSTEQDRWQLESHVNLVDTGDGAVLLDTRRGTYWQVNASAAAIFGATQEPQPFERIVEVVTAGFKDTEDPTDDIRALLHSALEAGLMRHA